MISTAFVDKIHATPHKGVILTAGGGSGIFAHLMRRGGASATVLDGGVPHGIRAVPHWLRLDLNKPNKWPRAVSSEVARGLAMASFMHASTLSDDDSPLFGVGCTVSLAKAGAERVGREHHLFAAVQTSTKTLEYQHTFLPGGTREDEETTVETVLLDLVRIGCELGDEHQQWFGDSTVVHGKDVHPALELLVANKVPYIAYRVVSGNLTPLITSTMPALGLTILSSSLNPLHDGHLTMQRIATEISQTPCYLEMPIRNANKPPLDYIEISHRLAMTKAQIEGILLLSNQGTFVEKSKVFPGSTFVIGYDTAIRIPDPAYYGGGISERDLMYETLADNQARFLVFGRVNDQGIFQNIDLSRMQTFGDEATTRFFRSNSQIVPESRFRADVSSSQMRS